MVPSAFTQNSKGAWGRLRREPAWRAKARLLLLLALAAAGRKLTAGLRQVKVAEHVLTSHKVAIKILNRKKIKQMDMEEKGAAPPVRKG